MKGRVHYQQHSIEEVMDYFIDAFREPNGEVIRRVVPHYDPRRGSVIFEMYLEPKPTTQEVPEQ